KGDGDDCCEARRWVTRLSALTQPYGLIRHPEVRAAASLEGCGRGAGAVALVCRCYGDLHAAMASGRVRLATEGGAKIARWALAPPSRSRLISRYPTAASSHRR